MNQVIRTVAEVTPDRLTALLAASARHQANPIESIDIRHTDAFNSTVAHLELHYRDDPVGPFNKLVLSGQFGIARHHPGPALGRHPTLSRVGNQVGHLESRVTPASVLPIK